MLYKIMSGEKYSYFIICRNRTVFSHPDLFNISELSLEHGPIFKIFYSAFNIKTMQWFVISQLIVIEDLADYNLLHSAAASVSKQ